LPERISDEGLISAGKRTDEIAAWNDPSYVKAQSRKESITNPDRGAGLRSEQMRSLRLSNDQAQMLVDKRTAWSNEPDPVKKSKLAEEYQTLSGKDPDKFAPVMGKDAEGNPVFMGSFDTKNNKFTSASELSGGGGSKGIATPEQISAYAKQKGIDVTTATAAFKNAGYDVAVTPAPTQQPTMAPKSADNLPAPEIKKGRDVTPYADKLQMLMDRQPARSAPKSQIDAWNAELVKLRLSEGQATPKNLIRY
jgi:hypothetical protein